MAKGTFKGIMPHWQTNFDPEMGWESAPEPPLFNDDKQPVIRAFQVPPRHRLRFIIK